MPFIADFKNNDFILCSQEDEGIMFFTSEHFDSKRIDPSIQVNTITGCLKPFPDNYLKLDELCKYIPIQQEGLIDLKHCSSEEIRSIPLGNVYQKTINGQHIRVLPHNVNFKYVFKKTAIKKMIYVMDTYVQEVRFPKTKAGTPQLMKCQYIIPESCLENKPENGQYEIYSFNDNDKTISIKYTDNSDKIWTIPNPKKKFRNCIITNLCIGYIPLKQPIRKSYKKYGEVTHERIKVNFKIFSNGTINFSGCTNIDIINYSINKLLSIFYKHMKYEHISAITQDIEKKIQNINSMLLANKHKFITIGDHVNDLLNCLDNIQNTAYSIDTINSSILSIMNDRGYTTDFIRLIKGFINEINVKVLSNNNSMIKPSYIKLFLNELQNLVVSIESPYRQRINMINCKFRYCVGVKLTKIIQLMNEQNVVEKRPVKVKHYQGLKIEYPKNPNISNKKNNKNPTIIVFEQQRNKINCIPGSSIILTGCKNDTDVVNCYNLINNFLNSNLKDIQETQSITEQLFNLISSDDDDDDE